MYAWKLPLERFVVKSQIRGFSVFSIFLRSAIEERVFFEVPRDGLVFREVYGEANFWTGCVGPWIFPHESAGLGRILAPAFADHLFDQVLAEQVVFQFGEPDFHAV